MTTGGELRDLAARALADLSRGSDYYHHTRAAWRSIQRNIADGISVEFDNTDTGRRAEGESLSRVSQYYVTGYLAESVFQHYVALFEDYTFGLIGLWLAAYPKGIVGLGDDQADDKMRSADKTVPLSVIVDNPDRDAILRAVIERELDRLKYRRLAAWFEYFERRARLGVPTADQIDRLVETKAARDILAHNRGIVNSTYLAKAGPAARYADGDRLQITDRYLSDCWQLVTDVVRATADAALEKLASAATPATHPS